MIDLPLLEQARQNTMEQVADVFDEDSGVVDYIDSGAHMVGVEVNWTPLEMEDYLFKELGEEFISRWESWWEQDFNETESENVFGPCYRWKFGTHENVLVDVFYWPDGKVIQWKVERG